MLHHALIPRTMFLAVVLCACSAGPNTECTLVGIPVASQEREVTPLHRFQVKLTVFACTEDCEGLPNGGHSLFQAAVDEVVASLRSPAEFHSTGLAPKIRDKINLVAGRELAKEVQLDQVRFLESAPTGLSSTPASAAAHPSPLRAE
jgi:hypothetical protein